MQNSDSFLPIRGTKKDSMFFAAALGSVVFGYGIYTAFQNKKKKKLLISNGAQNDASANSSFDLSTSIDQTQDTGYLSILDNLHESRHLKNGKMASQVPNHKENGIINGKIMQNGVSEHEMTTKYVIDPDKYLKASSVLNNENSDGICVDEILELLDNKLIETDFEKYKETAMKKMSMFDAYLKSTHFIKNWRF